MRRNGVPIAQLSPQSASELADMPSGGSSAGPGIRGGDKAGGHRIGIRLRKTHRGRPRKKVAKAAAAADNANQIHGSETLAGRVNVRKGGELRLKCVASGIRRRGAFCVFSGSPHFRLQVEPFVRGRISLQLAGIPSCTSLV